MNDQVPRAYASTNVDELFEMLHHSLPYAFKDFGRVDIGGGVDPHPRPQSSSLARRFFMRTGSKVSGKFSGKTR